MSDTICQHMVPADQCLHCLQRLEAELQSAKNEAAFFRQQTEELLRVIQRAFDCFPEMPLVARQTLAPYAQELR
jgi:hypothetical protein